jgi:hypothetical protein
MCYEFWRDARKNVEEKAAREKAAELIDKARTAKPMPEPVAPAGAGQDLEQEQETIPA